MASVFRAQYRRGGPLKDRLISSQTLEGRCPFPLAVPGLLGPMISSWQCKHTVRTMSMSRCTMRVLLLSAASSPYWCKVVNGNHQRAVSLEMRRAKTMKTSNESPIRASISFPPDLYRALEEVAKQKKVSLAWIVRDAAEQYLANQKQVLKPE
jgi:hypothetical protein